MRLYFKFDRETKRTYRFQEVGFDLDNGEDYVTVDPDVALIGTLYVKKAHFARRPAIIAVTIDGEVDA